ncbi:MAG: phosphopyruvate hydratase [Candidatus Bathyarchaeota archaeon]|nr:phosphopyruvate hydratase [Candidatus Bathyarchaeota archaeon]
MGIRIKSVHAREVFGRQLYPAVETTVVTDSGASGTAIVAAGASIGTHESAFVFDTDRFEGKGVTSAVTNVNDVIAPALIDMEVTQQRQIDETLLNLDGTDNKSRLGANAMGSVSAAVLRAAANALQVPLYRYIGGINATILPVPGAKAVGDQGTRYGRKQDPVHGKPSYEFVCYGFTSFTEAAYAGWKTQRRMLKRFQERKFPLIYTYGVHTPVLFDRFQHDRELWEILSIAIEDAGYPGQIGLQVDVGACTYYDSAKQCYHGLFSPKDKTQEDMIELYRDMVATFPFVILEDPLDENDFEGHAVLTRELGIEIVGDDLFTTNSQRLQQGIQVGAANTMLLKVNQVGTISEAFDAVQLAYQHGYGVMPCSSRGEGAVIADYTVGLGAGHQRGGAASNRLLKIEAELGDNAKFLGKKALKIR